MGQRINKHKKKQKNKNKLISQVNVNQSVTNEFVHEKVMTIKQKNDTIKEVDYFGFSPKLFMEDLKKTTVATIVIIAILVTVKFLI